ncbi:MAG: hypothetical protein BA865_07030 [Desulfobacterales bacterium S5133MH4]|nr:MAG: hypothetical protein BA865_07030 [Desulfobacterales bacterium S5133MH4]
MEELELKTKVLKRMFVIVLLFSSALLAAGIGAMADEPSRVVIVPFKMNTDRDLSFLKEGIVDMLTSRLSLDDEVIVVGREDTDSVLKEVSMPFNEKTARAVGTRLQADYVLFGSLTILGNSVSLDGKMVDVHQKRPTLNFFKQGKEIDDVIPQIGLFATEIKEKVFGSPVAAGPQVPKGPEHRDVYAHPETLLAVESIDQEGASSAKAVPEAVPELAETSGPAPSEITSAGFWKSQDFKVIMKGIALGDIDGDSKTEVVFIGDRRVCVHRFENQRLVKIWEDDGKRHRSLIGVDVADVNGNGRAEIFVTSVHTSGERLNSYVLEWDGHGLEPISQGDSWYYRVIEVPDLGRVLLGQKRSMDRPFLPGVYPFTWRNGEYAPEGALTLPKGVNIFGFSLCDLMNNGQQMTIAFDRGDHVCIFNPSGQQEWKSGKCYGGSMNYVESWSKNVDTPRRHYLSQRIYIRDLDGDGKQDIVVPSNKGSLGRLFARLRWFSSGHMACLSWKAPGLAAIWQTPELSGYISDYAIGDFDNDGRDEVVVAHVAKRGTIISSAMSSIIGYELTQPSQALK